MKKRSEILVDVYMITYNHGKYIQQAIESVLKQKVNFKYRLIISDDCSTDNTVKILKKYKKEYSDKIELILRKQNVGMKENSRLLRERLTAPYLAPLEGDDYWVDDNKLQKQVDFLEKNKDYNCFASSVYIVDSTGKRNLELEKSFINYCYHEDKEFCFEDALNYGLPGQTASLLYRNLYKNYSSELKKMYNQCRANGDQKLALTLNLNSRTFCSKQVLAAHRKVFDSGDSWSARTVKKNMARYHFEAICDLEKLAWKGFSKKIDMQMAKDARFYEALNCFRGEKNFVNFNILLYLFVHNKGKSKMLLTSLKEFL